MKFNQVGDDKVVLWNGRSLRDLEQRLAALETKFTVRSLPAKSPNMNNSIHVSNATGVPWVHGQSVGYEITSAQQSDPVPYMFANVFEGTATDQNTVNLGIVHGGIQNNSAGKVLIAGMAVANVNVLDSNHLYCTPSATDGFLDSTASVTSIRLVHKYGLGTNECKVILGAPVASSSLKVQAPVGGVPGRSTSGNMLQVAPTTCRLIGVNAADELFLTSTNIPVYNWSHTTAGAEGDRIVIVSRHDDGLFWTEGYDCNSVDSSLV